MANKRSSYAAKVFKQFKQNEARLISTIDHRTDEGKDVEDAFYVPPYVLDQEGRRIWSF